MTTINNIKMLWAAFVGFFLPPDPALAIPLQNLKLPPGYKIEVFAKELDNPRSMTWSPNSVLYVGTRSEGVVYALKDQNKNGIIDKTEVHVVAKDLNMPNGVAWKNGDLYVAEVGRILKFEKIDSRFNKNPKYQVVYDKLPKDKHHGWKYIAFGPDGWLYIPVGAPCNICKSPSEYAAIHRLNVQTKQIEPVAFGVRNSVGFAWHPKTNKFWFTDNGRDWLGDDKPECELNKVTQQGEHFGYPFCHADGIVDPEFGKNINCDKYSKPAQKLGPHVAPLGMEFHKGHVLIAEHGSWNRSKKIGYRITRVKLRGDQPVGYEVFVEGWLQGEEAWGRPVDILSLPSGELLISDDFAGVIYKLSEI